MKSIDQGPGALAATLERTAYHEPDSAVVEIALLPYLEHQDRFVRERVARALIAAPSPAVLLKLRQCAEHDPDETVRRVASSTALLIDAMLDVRDSKSQFDNLVNEVGDVQLGFLAGNPEVTTDEEE